MTFLDFTSQPEYSKMTPKDTRVTIQHDENKTKSMLAQSPVLHWD